MKKYKVVISREALDMLKEHMAFLANVSKKAATKTKNDILESINDLSSMPQKYPFFNEPYIPQNKNNEMQQKF
ncbi:MAG: hypothetical protein K6B52_02990 [Clostridiales bacterium]|nr:hypothetical protein [Clostridiales bacterium]